MQKYQLYEYICDRLFLHIHISRQIYKCFIKQKKISNSSRISVRNERGWVTQKEQKKCVCGATSQFVYTYICTKKKVLKKSVSNFYLASGTCEREDFHYICTDLICNGAARCALTKMLRKTKIIIMYVHSFISAVGLD